MEVLLWLLIIAVLGRVVWNMTRKSVSGSKATATDRSTHSPESEAVRNMIFQATDEKKFARDFILEADKYVQPITGQSVADLARSDNRDEKATAINLLIETMKLGDTYARKYCYFAFGQIGEEIALEILAKVEKGESAMGMLAAISGARKAVIEAPVSRGFSEADRRVIIEEEYFRYNNPSSKQQKFTA